MNTAQVIIILVKACIFVCEFKASSPMS